MANHLIIGLGGTGGRVLKAMRERVFQEFHTNNPDKGTYVNYLYVDSSNDLKESKSWQVMGNRVGLEDTQTANTNGTVTLQTLREIHRNEVLNAIITEDEAKRALEDGDIRGIIVQGIGGQRRRFGRLLIANSLQTMAQDGFLPKIKESVSDLQKKGNKETDVTFHICAGLAGGTGSGSIIDVVSQIRTLYPRREGNGPKYTIYLYLYIPENGETKWDAGYYHANGYAALRELNALSVGKLEPVDISGARDPKTGHIRRLKFSNGNVFNAAFVYSNSNGKRTAGEELNRIVADFIYQIIFETVGDEVIRTISDENNGMGEEDKVRSRQFLSLGLSRLEYPEYEIKDYMAYNFAEQALSQFLYNEWLDGQGFTHVEKTKASAAYEADLRDVNKRESLGLANKKLTLESPIIPRDDDAKWRDFRTEWRTRCDNFNKTARRLIPAQWTGEFLEIAENYFREGYRGLGVHKFYEAEMNNLDVYAKYICDQIEAKLFDEWCDGKKGLLEVRIFLGILIRVLQEYVPDLEQKVEEARVKAKKYEDRRDHERTVIINKSGSILYIHRDKDFDDFCNNSCEYYIHATQEEGWQYAVRLLNKVIIKLKDKLDGLESDIYNSLDLILNFEGDENKSNMGIIMAIREKLKEDQLEDGEVTKLYDPKKIKEIRTEFIHDKKLQARVAEQVRTKIILAFGDSYEHTFAAFSHAELDQEKLKDLILKVCFDEAEKTLNEFQSQKILGIDICEKLVKENPGRYEGIISDLIKKTSPYIEESGIELSDGRDKMKGYQYIVYIPKGKDTRSYDKIVEAVKGAAASAVIAENNKSNQIVVQAIHRPFPLRHLLNLQKMREKYEQLIISKENGDLNRIVLYTQPFDSPLPQLYKRTREELQDVLAKPILLGYAMGLFEKSEDEDGVTFDAINVSKTGISENIRGGKGLLDTIEVLARDEKEAEKVMEFIQEVLANKFRHNAKKAELTEKIESIYKDVIASQYNEWSAEAKKWKGIVKNLFDNELQQK